MEPRVHIPIRIGSLAPSQQSRLEVKRIRITEQGGKRFLLDIGGDTGRLQFRLDELCFLRIERTSAWNEKRKGDTTHACLRKFRIGIVDVVAVRCNATAICPTARRDGTLCDDTDTFEHAIDDLITVNTPLDCSAYMNIREWCDFCVEHDPEETESGQLFIGQAGIRFRRRNIVGP